MTKFTESHMTNQQQPITPPPELVQQLQTQYEILDAIVLAYRAGADQELEAYVEWLQNPYLNVDTYKLHRHRRPKPPSLKKEAYAALDTYIYGEPDPKDKERTYNIIRKALETLDD